MLRGGDRAAPDRHQTLEAVIEWSWQLLPESPRQALRALSEFPDGFSLSGAEAVLGREALTDIGHLAEQSLLVVREDEELRYRFLETVREFAAQRLDETGERPAVEERLSAWAVTYARSLAAGLNGPDQIPTVTQLREEAGNLTGVLRRALEQQDAETVVPLLATLAPYWTIRGDHASVFTLAAPVQDLLADFRPPDGEEQELRAVLADLAMGTIILSGEPMERSLDRLRDLGPGPAGARGHGITKVMLAMFGEDDTAALEELADDEDSGVALTALVWLCQIQENSGELDEARATSQRALERVDDQAGPWVRAMTESQMAGLAFQNGDVDTALASLRRALPTLEALGALDDVVQLRSMEAMAELTRGDVAAAERSLDAVVNDERARRSLAWIFGANGMAELALAKGDVERGLQLFRESVEAARTRSLPGLELETGLTPWVLFSLASALAAHVQQDRADDAADLAQELQQRLPELLALDDRRLDVPVVGGVMFALGGWGLVADGVEHADAVRLLAMAERFGYYRGSPSLSWERASELAERHAPGVLAPLVEEYAGRRSRTSPRRRWPSLRGPCGSCAPTAARRSRSRRCRRGPPSRPRRSPGRCWRGPAPRSPRGRPG